MTKSLISLSNDSKVFLKNNIATVRKSNAPLRKAERHKLHYIRVNADKINESIVENKESVFTDDRFMEIALREAEKGSSLGEVPVGAVLVLENKVISKNYNRTESDSDPTAHAEILCIREGAKDIGWRLNESRLYVTLEPCPMCAGAILQSRIKKVIFGAKSPLLGAAGSYINLLDTKSGLNNDSSFTKKSPMHPFHPSLELRRGVLEEECETILKKFFRNRRNEL